MLEVIFIYVLIAATSATAYLLGVQKLALKRSSLSRAFGELAECLGASLVFFVLNAGVGLVIVFAIRKATRFFTLYTLLDPMLPIFSVIQGFAFQLWRRRSENSQSPKQS